ncbi:MAG TPA: zinc-ribbon domain-containing protein, partial [Kofleriaceae bacterium]
MDVRCEKCQTEYELDEARLKPGGVTVKCTNCGHMFKIRKRTITNVGLLPGGRDAASAMRARTGSSKPVTLSAPASASASPGGRAPARPSDSLFDDERSLGVDEAPTTVERQWLIRLENGEQKSCRELATLQQWIISGVVTRESLISRTGKTWKRIGDIADLGQYFAIADEARANRDRARPPSRPGPIASIKELPGTLPGYSAAQAAGGTILPDDDDDIPEGRTTRAYQSRPVVNTPPPVPTRGVARSLAPVPSPPSPSIVPSSPSPPSLMTAPTELAAPPQLGRQVRTTPPPPPPKRAGAGPSAQPPAIPPPLGNRATAAWATDGVKPAVSDLPASAQSGPFVGKLAAIPDESAFAGRVRIAPGDAASFDGSRVRALDDDDELLPARRGSRAGMWVLIMALLVMGISAAAVYLFVLRTGRDEPAAKPAKDAGAAAVAVTPAPDAAAVATPPVPADAAAVEP